MAKKKSSRAKETIEDSIMRDEVREPEQFISSSTIIVFCAYAILMGLFLFLLDQAAGKPFTITSFIIGLVITLVITCFLLVVSSIMRTNSWEGFALGIGVIVVAVAALLVKFKGVYTYVFAAVGVVIALIYMGYYLRQNSKK